MSQHEPTHSDEPPAPRASGGRVVTLLLVGAVTLMVTLLGLYLRAAAHGNRAPLTTEPKLVTVESVAKGTYRATRTYVGTLEPWAQAAIGPQYVSAYVGTVLVRPGAVVKRGEVLATLDCRNASAASKEIAARARALEERRNAVAAESERMKQLIAGGFASENEVEQLQARAAAGSAEVESMRASLASKTLEVDDCVLRAPFAGEVSERYADPGAYVRPGHAVVALVDRTTVRVAADAPEPDFAVVAPGTPVRLAAESTGTRLTAAISRRAPSADESTRTVHFEIDVPNPGRALPVGTTVTLTIDVGPPVDAALVPSTAATLRGDKATLFAVTPVTERGERSERKRGNAEPVATPPELIAKRVVVPLLGESDNTLYLAPAALPPGTRVVVEGRALLDDGDRVTIRDK